MSRTVLYAALLGLLASACVGADTPKVVLDSNESLFTVLAAINACGFDNELGASDPLREQIRKEISKGIQATDESKAVTQEMCEFYTEHRQQDPSRDLAQYISLGLYLGAPPTFTPKLAEAELPPDARYVVPILTSLRKFYDKVGVHEVWERHHDAYLALTDRYHEPLAKMLFDTEIYLKLPSAGYLGRQFTIYLDAMGAPGQTNARNYGSDYFVVISPGPNSSLKMEQIRHTYLHYLLDPMAQKYPSALQRMQPLLEAVRTAPLDESVKGDAGLLVTESLIRAIEARTMGTSKTPEDERLKMVSQSMSEGLILTQYFYDALIAFEKDPAGLRYAYGDMLGNIDVGKEVKRAAQVEFAGNAAPELLHLTPHADAQLVASAEKRLSAGDLEAARKLAQQALDEKSEDSGRALFVLAQVATMSKDMEGARGYFQRALEVAQEPKVVAWSHIYLGRIFDLQENRPAALDHYRAALTAGSGLPEAKAAAERGLQQPYEPPSHSQ